VSARPEANLPSALAERTRFVRLPVRAASASGGGGAGGGGGGGGGGSGVPALLAHPTWSPGDPPAPTLIWMHGRTVSKELDNGRYLRLIRAGVAVCAVDLPGHGERLDPEFHQPERTLDLLAQAVAEVDGIVHALGSGPLAGFFDTTRVALGGMSAGGMVTLRRLCDAHPFVAAAVEGTAGNLHRLYIESPPSGLRARHDPARVAELDPLPRVSSWRPIPLLAMHSEADRIVPIECVTSFLGPLRSHYARLGVPEGLITLKTWPTTGAPEEHNGFGRVASEAKSIFVDFLVRALGGTRPAASP
jgi:pimeloyl-ACP methyl ester carboxylesterase